MSSIEARLSYLGFQLIQPSLPLRPFISAYWLMRREALAGDYHEEFMHALGGFGLVLNFGDEVQLNGERLREPIFLDGANSQSRRMGFSGRTSLLGIRFREGAAYPFFGIPLAELNNQTALIEILGEESFMPLYESLAGLPLAEKIARIEGWLQARLAIGKGHNHLVWEALRQIKSGLPSMEALALEINVGQRQLERLFQQQVGLSPKHYARLLRIEAARKQLKQPVNSLTELGLSLGFYDQSHFIREFKAVVGLTPSAYILHSREKAR